MTSLIKQVNLLQSETDRLVDYLASISDDAWSSPTACEQWDVATVVAHLTGAADAFSERIKRGLNGDTSVPDGLPDAGSVNGESWAETNAERWISIREGMGNDLLSAFEVASNGFNKLIAGLSPEDLEKPCYHPGGIVPVRTLIGFRLLELAVHGWDIRSELESLAHLSSEVLPSLIEFISDYLEWFFVSGAALPEPIRYRFDTGSYDIVVDGDKARMEEGYESSPDVTFKCGAEDFVLLMCGRITLDSLIANKRLIAEGDNDQVSYFSRYFRGA